MNLNEENHSGIVVINEYNYITWDYEASVKVNVVIMLEKPYNIHVSLSIINDKLQTCCTAKGVLKYSIQAENINLEDWLCLYTYAVWNVLEEIVMLLRKDIDRPNLKIVPPSKADIAKMKVLDYTRDN